MADEVTWVQCEACDKWRRVPHLTPDQVPDECKEKRGESGQVASW